MFCLPAPKLAKESVKKMLVIGMQNPTLNPSTVAKEGGGHLVNINTRLEIISEDQPNSVFKDPFGREIDRKVRIDLDHARDLAD